MNTAIIYRLLGAVLVALAAAFSLSLLIGLYYGDPWGAPSTLAFAQAALIALGLALLCRIRGQRGGVQFFRREALCGIGLSWLLATAIGSLPYALIAETGTFADALFESASGFTTTGATAYPDFADFPESLLFFRSLSQWVGGLGVVVFFVALLSSLGAGAKILFSNESSGTSADFEHGRIQRGALQLLSLYLGLSLACAIAYHIAGMQSFDAICHAMTTIATGGFSTEAKSIEGFDSAAIEWIAIAFMTVSATTFVFAIRLFRGKFRVLRQNHEVFWFYVSLLGAIALMTLFLVDQRGALPSQAMVREAAFQVVSIHTTTGYSSADFGAWLPPAQALLLILMVFGGCSGSTAGGVKMVRIVVAVRAAARSVVHAFRPNLARPIRMGDQPLHERSIHSAVMFLTLTALIYLASNLIVAANEPHLDFLSLTSCVHATLFNIGPGFGAVGPAEHFGFLRDSTKTFLAVLMVLGRLELYAILVLFVPSAWKKYS